MSPLPTENLTKQSSDKEVKRVISDCIRMARKEGKPIKECLGMCLGSAREYAGERDFLKK